MHRDIRPSNIFYSPLKKTYIIGGMANAMKGDKKTKNSSFKNNETYNSNIGINLAGVPYYMPKYLAKVG